MFGFIAFFLSLTGFILMWLPLPFPMFVASAISLSGVAISYSRKKLEKGEKRLFKWTRILGFLTFTLIILYYILLATGTTIILGKLK
jgi:hypothetical protein